MPSNYSDIMMIYPTQQHSKSQPLMRNMSIFERLGRAIDMGKAKHEYTLPSGENIDTYMPADDMYRYEKTIDRPEHNLRYRDMRRRGDTATEPCSYDECVTFAANIARPLFNKELHHAEF
eukprot:9195445-Karenia_brevis.AAC.1